MVAKMNFLAHIVAMKYRLVFLVLAFAISAFGQDTKPTPVEGDMTANWSKMGKPVEGSRGFTLQGKGIRINQAGAYELWVKIIPANSTAFIKRYSLPKTTEYVLQHATVDCGKKLLFLEKTAAYDSSNKVIEGNVSALTPSSQKSLVRPGSIGETLFRAVCDDPSILPKD